ncbi:MAG TPA: hypothetical protein VKA34_20905 [Balneolales bacterium]|nr:hypothetical protein [Balneolales bacterium]
MVKKLYKKIFSDFGCKPFTMSIVIGTLIGMSTNHLALGLGLGIVVGFILGKNGVCI